MTKPSWNDTPATINEKTLARNMFADRNWFDHASTENKVWLQEMWAKRNDWSRADVTDLKAYLQQFPRFADSKPNRDRRLLEALGSNQGLIDELRRENEELKTEVGKLRKLLKGILETLEAVVDDQVV